MCKPLILLATASFTLAACSQENYNVPVNQKGHMFFGRDGTKLVADDNHNPPRLATYTPSPYSPDFRVRNGKVNLGDEPVKQTASYSYIKPEPEAAPAPIESRDIASPQDRWKVTKSAAQKTVKNKSSFIPPVEANVITGYGKQENGSVNDGINYLIPAGEPVFASSDGTVAYVGDELKSYGNMVIIKHDNGYNSSYAHLGRSTIAKGDTVKQGEIIGYVGQTGNVERPQLHFGIRQGSDPVNPNALLSKHLAAN